MTDNDIRTAAIATMLAIPYVAHDVALYLDYVAACHHDAGLRTSPADVLTRDAEWLGAIRGTVVESNDPDLFLAYATAVDGLDAEASTLAWLRGLTA